MIELGFGWDSNQEQQSLELDFTFKSCNEKKELSY